MGIFSENHETRIPISYFQESPMESNRAFFVSPLAKIGWHPEGLNRWLCSGHSNLILQLRLRRSFCPKKRSLDGNSTRSKHPWCFWLIMAVLETKRLWLGGVLSEWFGRENDEKHPRKIYCQDSPGGSFKDFWIFFQITKLLFPVRLSGGKISHFSYFQLSEWWFPPKLVSDPLGEMITIWRAAQKPPTMVAHQQGVELHRYVVEFSYSIYIYRMRTHMYTFMSHTQIHTSNKWYIYIYLYILYWYINLW